MIYSVVAQDALDTGCRNNSATTNTIAGTSKRITADTENMPRQLPTAGGILLAMPQNRKDAYEPQIARKHQTNIRRLKIKSSSCIRRAHPNGIVK